MGSLTFDFLTDSFLFHEALVAEQFASVSESDLQCELQKYREFCLANEPKLLAEVSSHPSSLRVFSGLKRVGIGQLKQSALYVEQYVIDDPLIQLTSERSEFAEGMNKLLGMQAHTVHKKSLARRIRYLKEITPMVAAGVVKLLPVSVVFEPPKELPIFHSDNYFDDVLPAEILRIFREHAIVKSLTRMPEGGWRVENELYPCRAIEIEYQGHPSEEGYFYTFHDFHPDSINEADHTIRFALTVSDAPLPPQVFAVWIRQSVNRSAQDLYTRTFDELRIAGSIGALYCTDSELLGKVLSMQVEPNRSIAASTTSAVMNLELPFLADMDIAALMRLRTEEGDAFQNFRTELEKKLNDLRSIDDAEKARAIAEGVVHDLTEVQIRDIENKLTSLKEKLWVKAALGTVGLLAAVPTKGISLLATANAIADPILEYRNEVKRHPAFFLWRMLKRTTSVVP
jgi:hypothetical protein